VDGDNPRAGLIRDNAGSLYGTTLYGGAYGNGTVFEIDAKGNYKALHSFAGGSDGSSPNGVIRDAVGDLYGTTMNGGSPLCRCGTVFKLDPTGKETVIYRFRGGQDGSAPSAGVIRDEAGYLYGTTSQGGPSLGTVFRIDSLGKENVLYRFSGNADGSTPMGGLIRDAAGNFYGTTLDGGSDTAQYGFGVVFKLDPSGHETVLHTFTGGDDGAHPWQTLIFCGNATCGTSDSAIFKVEKTGETSVLYGSAFGTGPDGGSLIRDSAGNFYGITMGGGAFPNGTIYKLDASGNMTILHAFTGNDDGKWPMGGLVRDRAGNLYGITTAGGDLNCDPGLGCGTVYVLKP